MKNIFKILLCVCALSVGGAGAAYAGPKEDAIAAYDEGDYKRAARLFEPLAKHGDAVAQYNLGRMYDTGLGVARNYKEAARWYGLAAAQDLASAQDYLGMLYQDGVGVVQDHKEAFRLYGLAAAQGNRHAQFKLGEMFEDGRNVARDYKEAARLYGLAAAQGFAGGQNYLGMLYESGKGVAQDYKEAARLYGLAAAQGDGYGKFALDALNTKLNDSADEQKAQARAEQDSRDAAARAEENAKAVADAQAAEQARIDAEKKQDDAECKSFGAVVGSPAYVQCRISLKALRQGVLENQQKAAQDNARAGELKAQSEQQQRLTQQRADQEAALQRQAAAQQQAIFEKERSDRKAMALLGLSAALLQGGAASRPPAPSIGTHTYNMNGRIVTCTTTANFTNCF